MKKGNVFKWFTNGIEKYQRILSILRQSISA